MKSNRFTRLLATAGSLARVMIQPLALLLLAVFFKPLLAGALFVAGTAFTDSDFVRQLWSVGLVDKAGGFLPRAPVAKTNNYQIVSPLANAAGDACGTLFTTRGAGGAVTFTLPAITGQNMAGLWYEFAGVANQNIGVAAAAGTVVTFNNAAATSVTASTAGGKIGAHFRAICDGTSWHVIGDAVGVTYTVA
jgi:hypothetical protein